MENQLLANNQLSREEQTTSGGPVPFQLSNDPSIDTPVTSKPRTHLKLFMVIALSSALLLGGYMLGKQFSQKSSQKSKLADTSSIPTKTPLLAEDTISVSPTAATSQTADWKTYTDPANLFSFQYQPDGVLTEGSNSTQEKIIRIITAPNDQLELFVQTNDSNLPLTEYIKQAGGDYPGLSAYKGTVEDSKTFGQLTGSYIVFPLATKTQFDTSGVQQNFYFQVKQKVYWMRLIQSKDQLTQADKDLFSQILTTFKLTSIEK